MKNFKQGIVGQNVSPYEVELVRKDGNIVPIELNMTTHYDVNGKVTGRLGISRDITKRKKAEEELKIQNSRYMALIHNIDGMVYRVANDKDWTVEFVSDGCYELTGYKPVDLINNNKLSFNDMILPKYQQYLWDLWQKKLRNRETVEVEYEMKTASGEIIWVWERGTGVWDDNNQLDHLEGIISDITTRKKIERELEQYRKHLEELVEKRTQEIKDMQSEMIKKERLSVLGQLSGSIGYELRNPLGVISNSVYFLNMKLNDKDKDEKVIKHLGFLKDEIMVADRLISELLRYSEEDIFYFTETNINKIIRASISEIKIPKRIELKLNFDEKINLIQLDPEQMADVIQKIIYNSINAISEDGKIEIKTQSNSEFTEIIFTDNGEGISEENQKHIFEPLFTTKKGGIGLGLAIVKNIIDSHNGEIDIKSEVGKGTIFTIKLRNEKPQSKI